MTNRGYPWHRSPEWASFAVEDGSGRRFWHEFRPDPSGSEWVSAGRRAGIRRGGDTCHPQTDWRNSLQERQSPDRDYASEMHSAPCLQIGERDMAVVTSDPPPQPAVLVTEDELAELREDRARLEWMIARNGCMYTTADASGGTYDYRVIADDIAHGAWALGIGDTARQAIDRARGEK